MEDRIQKLEEEIKEMRERNRRVEADKAWETSLFRVLTIVVVTYVVVSVVFWLIGVDNFLSAALIPMVAYFLSVQALPPIKRWWIRRNR